MSDAEWAESVTLEAGLDASDADRVAAVLAEAGVASGRTTVGAHSLSVTEVYFAGVKVLRDSDSGANEPTSEEAFGTVRLPFAFHHRFGSGMTVFATDGVNLAGKSTILGVLLWGIRGSVTSPTLPEDVYQSWLREAVVTLNVDSSTILVRWRVTDGRPSGEVSIVAADVDCGLASLRDEALERASNEIAGATADVWWPAEQLLDQLTRGAAVRPLVSFENAAQFEAAMAAVLMPRLDLEPVRLWQRNAGALDAEDGTVAEHGWKTLSQALTVLDPTRSSVLGETPIITNQLLAVFLGSGWSGPVITARWQLKKVEATLAALRRRADGDQQARVDAIDTLEQALLEAKERLLGLGSAPTHHDLTAATQRATRDAVALGRANSAAVEAANEHEGAQQRLGEAQADLHALAEAAATRRFWHSLRPSCCPRCDRQIDDSQWAREQHGHCSLCDSELAELTQVEVGVEAGSESDDEVAALDGDDEDQEDESAALANHVSQLERLVGEAFVRREAASDALAVAKVAAADSVAVLERLDSAAAADRQAIEREVAVLEGRIAERRQIIGPEDPRQASAEFVAKILRAADALATAERDAENADAIERVSQTILRLGIEYGIPSLVSAQLKANGHLVTTKGDTPSNFGSLPPGERLRLRVALIIGLLEVGAATGAGRHPGLLVIDDLTSHELSHDAAERMARNLSSLDGLQVITASTYGPLLATAVQANGEVVGPPAGQRYMF
ncbi:hypothetical protein ACFVSK_04125 [Cellulosimicrobium cellulans]|uniref:hypothetical protein n=1 Tax=Cellulosimicrobium cellulans TaxID=1710 RepID=UPI0036E0652C